jgi:coenzyme F420-reducing hydrogenase delta subunit
MCGLPYHSLSGAIKSKVKGACQFISRFEDELIAEALRGGFDGVVCGHIHKAESRSLGVAYYNCGDWVESCTALVEDDTGAIRVLDGLAFNAAHRSNEDADAVAQNVHAVLHDDDGDEWVAPTLPFPLPAVPARAKAVGE